VCFVAFSGIQYFDINVDLRTHAFRLITYLQLSNLIYSIGQLINYEDGSDGIADN